MKMLRLLAVTLSVLCVAMPAWAAKEVPNSAMQMQLSFAPLVKKAAPAVVNIYTKRKITVRNYSPFFNDPVFKHFFGDSFGRKESQRVESSLGSGVIVKPDGLIITSNHVIAKSDEITVVLADRREYAASVLVSDEKTDLALLQIDPGDESLPFLSFMDSDSLEVGDLVLAIGNPFGVGQTVTSGIVSSAARTTVGVSDYQFFIQTDAAINPGNSGGALITIDGKLAGINTAIYTRSGGSNGIGFAIPANMVATVINNSTGNGQVVRPWLGMSVEAVTQEVASALGMGRPQGALVKALYPKGPGKKSGLQVGDVITAIDGKELLDEHELHFRVATYKIGNSANLTVLRNGKSETIAISMEAPIEHPKRDLRNLEGSSPLSGAVIANLSPAVADMFDLDVNQPMKGVIITSVSDTSSAKRVGFRKKDIILQVNGVKVESTKQLEEMMESNSNKWKFTLRRGKRTINFILSGRF